MCVTSRCSPTPWRPRAAQRKAALAPEPAGARASFGTLASKRVWYPSRCSVQSGCRMQSESAQYRGYILSIRERASLWQVQIYPAMPDQPVPRPGHDVACKPGKAAAVAEARSMIDKLLAAAESPPEA